MRRTVFLVIGAFSMGFPILAGAQHNHHQHGSCGHDGPGMKADHTQASRSQVRVAKACPVSGKPVNERVSATFEGQQVKFCCPTCIDKYKASPDTYAPALYKQVYPQRVQTKCPVMGGDIDAEVFVEHKGEKVYFCCKGCDDKFQKNPARYEPKLKKAYAEQVHCPVMGGLIDPAISTEGKDGPVYFCCEECVDKFKADAARYEAAMLPAAGLLAHGETLEHDLVRCPVCPPNKVHRRGETSSVVRDGKTYFLCNDSCLKSFGAEPAKYVKQMEQQSKKPAPQQKHVHH